MSDIDNVTNAICTDIEAARGELVDLCARLVAAPSVNPPGRTTETACGRARLFLWQGVAMETVKADQRST